VLRRLRPRRLDDRGTSMVELAVSMTIVGVLVAAYLSMTVVMSRTTSRAMQVAQASTQLRAAVDGLGRQIPSATAVNTPTQVGNDLYLELYTDDVVSGAAPLCTQWVFRSATDVLQVRSWTTTLVAPTAWRTVVANVGNDLVTRPPFTVTPADSVHTRPVVTVDLVVAPPGQPTSNARSAYTLRNYDTGSGTVCTQVARS